MKGVFKTKKIENFVKKSVDQTLEILEYKKKRKTYVSVFLTNNEEIKKLIQNIGKLINLRTFYLFLKMKKE